MSDTAQPTAARVTNEEIATDCRERFIAFWLAKKGEFREGVLWFYDYDYPTFGMTKGWGESMWTLKSLRAILLAKKTR